MNPQSNSILIRSRILNYLMNYKTPFGHLKTPAGIDKKRSDAIQRALLWCESILVSTLWTPITVGNNISLQRTINGQTIEIFPLQAALMDYGMKSRFTAHHLPIQLNNQNACVRPVRPHSRALHTDLIASMMLLLGRDHIDPAALPRTLHAILTEEQMASLPPLPPPREAYVPGRPSTSGREFLPEPSILELTRRYPNATFSIQFEKRDGTLRNMTARIGVWNGPDGDEKNPHRMSDEMTYDPADYNLKTVVDTDLGEYRHIATDRVTQITIGEQTYQTASSQ